MDKYVYEINSVSCPLKEHSIMNYISRPFKKERKGRKRINNSTNNLNDEQSSLVKIYPLELNKYAKKSFLSYQSALASATESLFDELGFSDNNPSVNDLISSFSKLYFYDPCTQTFKSPTLTSISHIEYIFKNSDYFSSKYRIENNIIYRK